MKPYFQCAVCVLFACSAQYSLQCHHFLVFRVLATITTTNAAEYPILCSPMADKWSSRVPRDGRWI